ncbi:hypothetical protein BP6252_04555 [Coleophoma cylindrospora]|uniref:DUF4419 domain-containing protein n=1 Tax=Coleophoma cylindrospora TaxID=1849047 RepID=A0A3D8S0T9_9HELO|nr:hypothetical protein BP6252_04555 [Coleophoma cylindrospora]
MPVTIKPASHSAREWDKRQGLVSSATALLSEACQNEHDRHFQRMIQSSFSSLENEGKTLAPSSNGFVLAAITSYNHHHNLVLRPEDIWFSILSQLNFYINKNAEELRHLFVAHEGREELEVIDDGGFDAYDFGKHAETMTHLIAKNIKEPELREWIMPAFSTTTETDVVVASILMMGAMQKYFSYKFSIVCGLPSVKLLGVKEDWAEILRRLDRLPSLGEQAGQFGMLLKPVIQRFVTSFDQPDSFETKDFWQTIAHYSGGGSGPTYLSGWITAFCFWDADGNTLYESPPDTEFQDYMGEGTEVFSLDGVDYHRIDTDDIPQSYVSVPVKVNDNGNEFDTHMIAGSVAIDLTSSGDTVEACNGKAGVVGLDTLQPVSGWWIFEIKKPVEGKAEDY